MSGWAGRLKTLTTAMAVVGLVGAVVGLVPAVSGVWNAGRARTGPPTSGDLAQELVGIAGGTNRVVQWRMMYDISGSETLTEVAAGEFHLDCSGAEVADLNVVVGPGIVLDSIPWYAGVFASAYAYAAKPEVCHMLQTLPLIWARSAEEPSTWYEAGLPIPGMGHDGAPGRTRVYGLLSSMNEIPIWSPARNSFRRNAIVVSSDGTSINITGVSNGREFQRLELTPSG